MGKVAYLNYDYNIKDLVLKEGTVGIADSFGSYYDTVTLPAGLKLIGDEAYINVENQEEIVIPDGVTYIGMNSILGVKNIILPASVTYIDYTAFDSDATIIAPKGSYAESYALENDYKFKER